MEKVKYINDPNILLDKLKDKVSKEMKKYLVNHKNELNNFDWLDKRKLYCNYFDELYGLNFAYQFIIQSEIEDYIFTDFWGNKSDFPIKEFNFLLSEMTNCIYTLGGVFRWKVDSILDKPLNYRQFLTVVEVMIIEDSWKEE